MGGEIVSAARDSFKNGQVNERLAIVKYLGERAEWLTREVRKGGHPDLTARATECESLARLLGGGRHRLSGHPL